MAARGRVVRTRDWFAVVKEKVTPRERKRGIVAKGRLPSQASHNGRRAFVRLFMWRSEQHMLRAFPRAPRGSAALFHPNIRGHRLGDAHLCLGSANLEIVAHELTHALVHRMTMHGPDAVDVIAQRTNGSNGYGRRGYFYAGRADEEVAYEMGRWVFNAYLWAVTILRKRGLV